MRQEDKYQVMENTEQVKTEISYSKDQEMSDDIIEISLEPFESIFDFTSASIIR